MKNTVIGLLLIFLIGCSSKITDYEQLLRALGLNTPKPNYKTFYSESLHQAVALEKLPDVSSCLQNDTIDVFVAQIDDSSGYFIDAKSNDEFPYHVDKWYLNKLSLNQIKKLAEKEDVSYLTFYCWQDGSDFVVEVINDTYIGKGSDTILMDRGRLSIRFKYDKIWKVEAITFWYG